MSEPRALNKEDHKKCTSGSRLHLHGSLWCDTNLSMAHFLLKSQYYLTRWCDVQLNGYRKDYWPTYCKKQSALMKALATAYKIKVILTHNMAVIRR